MKLTPTPLAEATIIEPEPRADERGFFARIFCDRVFAQAGLEGRIVQINDSFSRTAHTLRGLHFQVGDDAEIKIVRCIRGSLFDVIVDIRPASPTYQQWFGIELTEGNRKMLYVPRGFAHGFMTLEPDTEMLYFVSAHYAPPAERGLSWNDPAIAIRWPHPPSVISEKDQQNPTLQELVASGRLT
jgi:dTDP-4-dehydrorhamnose 3,5-epimerase